MYLFDLHCDTVVEICREKLGLANNTTQLSIDRLTPARVTVSYRMEDAATGELRCEAMSEHCFFSRAKGRPVALKRDLPELYQKFQALCKQQKE